MMGVEDDHCYLTLVILTDVALSVSQLISSCPSNTNIENKYLLQPETFFQRMFKKFEEKESVSGVQQLKSSVQKGIRNSILDTFPDIADYLDGFLPKKDQFKVVKCHDHVELLINSGGDLLFWRFGVLSGILLFISNISVC